MRKYFNNFLLMIQMLTRIPINKSLSCELEDFKRGALFFPIIGAIIGAAQWITYFLLIKVLPSEITAIFIFLIAVLLTGALHIDGLGDTCDGFFAFKGRERIIEIMKDSRIGTYACIAIVINILLKVMAYKYIIEYNIALIIIIAPILGRFSILFISLIGKTAKSTGSGNLFIGNMSMWIVICSSFMTIVISVVFIGIKATIILFGASLIITLLVNIYSSKKIGGLTGDLLGANNELVEIGVLLVFLIIK